MQAIFGVLFHSLGGLAAGRYTFTTKEAMRSFNLTEPLSSGLLGPVTIQQTEIK